MSAGYHGTTDEESSMVSRIETARGSINVLNLSNSIVFVAVGEPHHIDGRGE